MSLSLRFRVQEWLADRFDSVQYPAYPNQPVRQRNVVFKQKIPLWQRLVMLQWALAILLIGSVLLGFGLFVAYVLLTAIFTA